MFRQWRPGTSKLQCPFAAVQLLIRFLPRDRPRRFFRLLRLQEIGSHRQPQARRSASGASCRLAQRSDEALRLPHEATRKREAETVGLRAWHMASITALRQALSDCRSPNPKTRKPKRWASKARRPPAAGAASRTWKGAPAHNSSTTCPPCAEGARRVLLASFYHRLPSPAGA